MITANFEAGRTYRARYISGYINRVGVSPADFRVTTRTEKTVTIRNEVNGQTGRRRLYSDGNGEYFFPESGCKEIICRATSRKATRDEYEEAIRAAHEEKTQKEMTATQAVEAIRAVETADEVKEVLMNCTQAEMLRAYKEMFGEELYDLHDKGKIDIAEKITDTIMYQREREWFQSLSFEERFEIITETTGGDALNKMCFCSNNELQEIARRLGIEFGDTQFLMSYYDVRVDTINAIYQRIVVRSVERKVEKYHTGELTANELDDFLQVMPIATLKEYARGKGIDLPPDDDRKEILKGIWEGILCDHFGNLEEEEEYEIPYAM